MFADPSIYPAPEAAPLLHGSLQVGGVMFGRYRLERMLGRGGMGIVWLARDEKLDRPVALKFLPEVLFMDAASRDELKRETRRSLELTHANIVRIHDFVEDDESAAISMEYIDGPTLSQLRVEKEARCFESEELTGWVAGLCRALDYAHHVAGFVHRDLKPANLMVTSRGTLKIADFGIACGLHNTAARISAWNSSGGTLGYMSPQQLEGELAAVTDDVYSLGATLYELLTSKPPFYSGDISLQIRATIPEKMAERRRKLGIAGGPISEVWEETIAACLAKDPRDRPASVREVARRLGAETFALSPHEAPAPEELTVMTRKAPRSLPQARLAGLKNPRIWGPALALTLAVVAFTLSRITAPTSTPIPSRAEATPAITREAGRDERKVTAPHAEVPAMPAVTDPAVLMPGGSDSRSRESAALPAGSVDLPFPADAAAPPTPSEPPRLTIETNPPGVPFALFSGAVETPNAAPIRQGETPATLDGLTAGSYRVVFAAAPWPSHSAALQIGDRGTSLYGHTFPHGIVHIDSTPPGAEIFVGQDSVGETPLEIPLPPGSHILTAEFKDRTSRPRNVAVVAEEQESVSFDFRTATASGAHRPVRRPKKKEEESALTKISRSIRNIFTTDKPKKH